ncbi:MAG: quinol:cytochrome C oxidoreductase [Thermoguttaceae bacterium]
MRVSSVLDIGNDRTTLEGIARPASAGLAAAGAVALAAAFAVARSAGRVDYALHAYLADYCFWTSISLGSLFFVGMLHVTRAGWGVVVRRLAEILGCNFTVLAFLFLPVLLGSGTLYEWANPSLVHADEALRHKAPYLNFTFFGVRIIAYFVVWWLISRFYLERSSGQDSSGDPNVTVGMERWSGPSLLLLSVTATYASFDWIMSLHPHWASTIFGVYYFSGAMVGGLAALILAVAGLQVSGRLRTVINAEHYHDLGKLLLGFVIFWGYIAFSQYMLIWYANIPEETVWYEPRLFGPWGWVALALLFGHLIVPFLGLMSREVKRRRVLLAFWAVWLLFFHWLDLQWLVMPRMNSPQLPFGAIDLLLMIGMGALYLAGLAWMSAGRSLVPMKDPRLGESLAFENY